MQLTAYISDLLQVHNCVIVPNFGGFIANYKSAVVDVDRKRIIPPGKNILFNANLITNDGLLGNTVSAGEAVSYPKALELIETQVFTWKKELVDGKRIEIGEIGFLYQQNNQIVFEQSREVNLLLSAYGLSSVTFVNFDEIKKNKVEQKLHVFEENKPVESIEIPQETLVETPVIDLNPEEPIKIVATEDTTTVAQEEAPKRKKRGVWKYAVAAAAVPLLFYTYWIPVETDFLNTGNIQFADFNPIHKTAERQYEVKDRTAQKLSFENDWKPWEELTEGLPQDVTVYNYQFDEQLYIPVRLDKLMVESTVTVEEKLSLETNASNESTPYHVIGGCFSVEKNATQFVADLKKKGFNARLLDIKNGLYRVSAGDYSSRNQAKENLESFKKQGFSGWILKK